MSPRLLLALAAFLFSTGGIAIKVIGLTPVQVASFRSAVAAVTLLLLIPSARKAMGWRTFLIGSAYAATLVSYVLANRLTTSANAIYLQSTSPLYLLLLAPWLLRERVRLRDLPIVAAVLGGLLLVLLGADLPSSTAPDPARGNLIGAFSGFTYALTITGLRWLTGFGDAGKATIAAVIWGNLIAAVAVLPWALPVTHWATPDLLGIIYLGVFQIGLAYFLVSRGLQQVPALEASLFLLVETAFNPLWVWLFLGETPTLLALAGGALIVLATVYQSVISARQPVQEAT